MQVILSSMILLSLFTFNGRCLYLFITAAACLLGSIVYKFGQTGGMISGAVLVLLFTIPVTKEPIIHFIKAFRAGRYCLHSEQWLS